LQLQVTIGKYNRFGMFTKRIMPLRHQLEFYTQNSSHYQCAVINFCNSVSDKQWTNTRRPLSSSTSNQKTNLCQKQQTHQISVTKMTKQSNIVSIPVYNGTHPQHVVHTQASAKTTESEREQ